MKKKNKFNFKSSASFSFINKIDDTIKSLHHLKSDNFLKNLLGAIYLIKKKIVSGNKILFCGNGGSAADSQHWAAELISEFLIKKRKAIPAIALTTNSSILTSISNDRHFSEIFSRQIEGLGKKNDILFCISTSGKSQNIINALKTAKKLKLKTILLTGKNFINNYNIDIQLNVNALRVDRIQEQHLLVGHYICEILEKEI
jgi:D-sedoheptulose 7-phosphate isomerase